MKTHNTANISSAANRKARHTHTVLLHLLSPIPIWNALWRASSTVQALDHGPQHKRATLLCTNVVLPYRPFPSHKLLASCSIAFTCTYARVYHQNTPLPINANQPLHRTLLGTYRPVRLSVRFSSCENCPWLFLQSRIFVRRIYWKSSLRIHDVARTEIGKLLP